jgi:hypothetical protein
MIELVLLSKMFYSVKPAIDPHSLDPSPHLFYPLLQGNKQNQDFISALQPQKIVQDDYLQSLGVSVHIDPQTGKISATSAPDSSPS